MFASHISHVRSHSTRDLKLDVARCSAEISMQELGIDFTDRGYVMVRMRIINAGGDRYLFHPSYCDLKRVSIDQLAEFIYYDTPTRCIWLSVPSFLFWWPAIPLVVVPCGMMWSQWNRQLERRVVQRLIDSETTFKIGPYETVEKFMLIPESSWFRDFSIGFFDRDTSEMVRFTVAFED